MKKVEIALLGLGNVGKGVWNILKENKDEIRKRSGYDIEIAKILVRDKNKNRGIEIPEELITTDYNDIINDESIKIVVEVMGGIDPARDYILQAMNNKKHVVTANKMLLATYGDELGEVADNKGVMLYYEASVAGGIPIIQTINESLTANKIEQVYGILNGTTNYILSNMDNIGMDFSDALKEAQEKGYAEADPTSDIESFDAAYKLAIIASLAFGTKVKIDDVYREGITKITATDIKYAKEFGYVIKLLGIVKEIEGKLELRVHPTFVSRKHPLANVNDAFNAIFIKGNAVGELMLYGRGAGELPTGSAVVADIISIVRKGTDIEDYTTVKNNLWHKEIKSFDEVECKYYLRILVKDKPGVLGEITTALGRHDVSLRSVIQRGEEAEDVKLILITHKTREENIQSALREINQLETVSSVENLIRIENL